MKAASEVTSPLIPIAAIKMTRVYAEMVWALSRAAAVFAAAIIVAMTLHILTEIVLRSLWSSSTFVLDEMVGYGIAGATFLSLGYAFEHSSLVRVGLLVERLSGWKRRALEALCAVATLAVMLPITWYFISTAWRSFSRGRVSSSLVEVPLWIPETICALGLVVFCLQLVDFFVRQFSGDVGPVACPDDDMQKDL